MLITTKTILQADLYKAFYDAYMVDFTPNIVAEERSYDANIKSAMEKKAIKYATGLSIDLTDAIYKFVKEIGIQASATGVIAPSGPCTGVIPPSNFKIL